MQNKYDFKIINRILRDIRDYEKPFSGLLVILNSDFAQILPVIKRANRARCHDTYLSGDRSLG
jgi:hypothetical protein